MSRLLFWIIAGGIAGWLASVIASTNERMGCILNIVVGVVGAVIGGWMVRLLGFPPAETILGTIVVAFLGAVVFLLLLKALARL